MSNGKSAFDFYVSQGLTPAQAAGIVGNLQGESGQDINPSAVNRGDGRDGSDSIGIAQWNGTRAQALKAYAASKGVPWTDLNTQLEFLHSELQGPEKRAYAALKAATTPEEAGRAFLGFERPKDWNVAGSHPERSRYAVAAMKAYGGSGTAPIAPSTPAGPPMSLTPPQAAPIFAKAVDSAPLMAGPTAGPAMTAAPTAPAAVTPSPIFAPPQKRIDLSGLRAALAARAPIFPSSQG